jgi:hypothetical protein
VQLFTPHIERELATSDLLPRYQASLATLLRAQERGSIRLPEWVALRRFLSRVAEKATAGPVNAYWLAHAQDGERLTQVGIIRTLKGASRLLVSLRPHARVPEVAAFVTVLEEIYSLYTVVEIVRRIVTRSNGLRPLVIAGPNHTATCPVCMKAHKLTRGKCMVHHGFAITDDYGQSLRFRAGKCPGTGFHSFEASPEGTVAYLSLLATKRGTLKARLRALLHGEITEIHHRERQKIHGSYVPHLVTTRSTDFMFPTILDFEIRSVQGQIDELDNQSKHLEFRVRTWKPASSGR